MKISLLNPGSRSQASCLYEFKAKAPATPSLPVWEVQIDWTHRHGSPVLKVGCSSPASLKALSEITAERGHP